MITLHQIGFVCEEYAKFVKLSIILLFFKYLFYSVVLISLSETSFSIFRSNSLTKMCDVIMSFGTYIDFFV